MLNICQMNVYIRWPHRFIVIWPLHLKGVIVQSPIIKSKIQMCEKIGRYKELIWILFLSQNNPVKCGKQLIWMALIGLGISLPGSPLFKSSWLRELGTIFPTWWSSLDPLEEIAKDIGVKSILNEIPYEFLIFDEVLPRF